MLVRPPADASATDAAEVRSVLRALHRARRRAGLTQTDVATKMGVFQPSVSALELGRVQVRVDVLQRYARACGARLRLVLETAPADEARP